MTIQIEAHVSPAEMADRFIASISENKPMRRSDVRHWEDARLIAAVRRDPPHMQALDELADRYWKPLFGRCRLLTLNDDKASDLAQEAWYRLLRTRHALKPTGNLLAYLTTIATNLWRDRNRAAMRAGPLAEHRTKSLEALHSDEDGESRALDRIPDPRGLSLAEQQVLAMDVDHALEQLTPQLREVLVARLFAGESCAEIGRRYSRTEQCISGWVRQALQELKLHLQTSRDTAPVGGAGR